MWPDLLKLFRNVTNSVFLRQNSPSRDKTNLNFSRCYRTATETKTRKPGAGSPWWRHALPWQRWPGNWGQVRDDVMNGWRRSAVRRIVSSPPGEWQTNHSPKHTDRPDHHHHITGISRVA